MRTSFCILSINQTIDYMITIDEIKDVTARVPDVVIPDQAEESTYAIAGLLMKVARFLVELVGLEHNSTVVTIVYAVLVFLIAMGIGNVVKWIVVGILRHLGKHVHNAIYGYLVEEQFFMRVAQLIPAIVFLILIEFTLSSHSSLASWLTRLTLIYILYIVSSGIVRVINVVWRHINMRANKRHLPLNGLAQLMKGVVWILFAIVTVAILLQKSPGSLLAGLGAFAAVLMLVFKDSILGVVAGVQLSENDSLHVGDWIASGEANGTVTEVSLTAVKVQNWDKTTTTLPPYNLISSGFTSYRSMQESNTRRIQRSYMIDADSVVPCDDVLLEEFKQVPMMKDWIEKKVAQRAAGKERNAANPDGLADGTIETNLGVFRAYLKMYLDTNPDIASTGPGNDCFISTLPQTANGIPLQIYCFTSTSKWIPYEAIMSALFEHIAVMLSKFHLYTFESESGRDTIIDGYLSPGKNPDGLLGIPYPLFYGKGTPENPAGIGAGSQMAPRSGASAANAATAPSAK